MNLVFHISDDGSIRTVDDMFYFAKYQSMCLSEFHVSFNVM